MKNNLQNIEQWLKKNANKIYQYSLNSPADEEIINELETLVGETLPNDFKTLYQWHNGMNEDENTGNLFYGYNFWDLDKVINTYKDKLSSEYTISDFEKTDDRINLKEFVHQTKWIQFADDGGRTGFYLDLNPSENGNYGQVIFIDYDAIFVVANSITDFVEQVDEDMQEGYYYLNEDALEDDNHFLEVDADIDILNWYESERWKN